MAGLNLQSMDRADRYIPETALVSAGCHTLTGGSSNPPKFGTLIPNRIFVGGIPSNTTEQELKSFFSSFGQVKDVKIISDRLGISKGSYGFVTFESQETAEKIIKNESETLIFKDRKLNIGHAIRKQQVFPRPDLPATLFFAGGLPYSIQNGMTVFSLPGQEYSMLTQAAGPYATMMLPQPGGGTALYLPSAATATTSPYAQLSQQQVTAALQQQHYQSAVAPGISPSVTGQLAPVTVSGNNLGAQSNSTAAAMAAAVAAMAAAAQWPPQTVTSSHPTSQSLPPNSVQSLSQTTGTQQTVVQNATLTPQQAAAVAAAVAAQQTAWRWSPTVQQTQTSHATNATHTPSTVSVTAIPNSTGNTASTPAAQSQTLHNHPQGSPTATLGPATYLYSPIAGTGHELMFFHQTSSPFAANSTSDYSTDHSNQSSGLLDSVEPINFPCDGTPLGRHSQQLSGQISNAVASPQLDAATCLSPYAAFAPLLDLQTQGSGSGQQNALIHSTALQHAFRHQHHSASTTILATPQAAPGQHIMPIAHAATSLLAPTHHSKLYSSSLSSSAHIGPSINTCLFAGPSMKLNTLSDLTSVDTQDTSVISPSSAISTTTASVSTSGLNSHNTTVGQMQSTNSGTVQCNATISGLVVEANSGINTATGHR